MKLLATSFFVCICFIHLHSQDGTLDETFGTNGTQGYNHFNANSGIQSIVRSGDFLYAAGYTKPGTRELFSILKVDLQGTPETSFGDQGVLRYTFGSGFSKAEIILAQPDGKLVAGGWARNVNEDHYLLVRFNPDGSPDNSFSGDGMVTGLFDNSSFVEDEIYDAALLSDGRIIIVGKEYNGNNNDGFVACFDAQGVPCAGFGNGGVHTIAYPDWANDEQLNAVAIDDNDNIYVAGRVKLSLFEDPSLFMLRFDSEGTQDNTFGGDGIAIHTISSAFLSVQALAIDHQGRILTGGSMTDNSDAEFMMTRFLPSGELDPDFGEDGVLILPGNGNENINDLLYQPDGKILAAGSTGAFPSEMFVVRLDEEGSLDLEFGDDGWALASLFIDFNGIESITLDEDGSIYGGGFTRLNSVFHMAIAKFVNTLTSVPPDYIVDNHFRLYPNPVNDRATLSFSALKDLELSMSVMTQDGKVVRQVSPSQKYSAGDHEIIFITTQELPGFYFLLLQLDRYTVAVPFQKM